MLAMGMGRSLFRLIPLPNIPLPIIALTFLPPAPSPLRFRLRRPVLQSPIRSFLRRLFHHDTKLVASDQ
jgi:hypothetical protein